MDRQCWDCGRMISENQPLYLREKPRGLREVRCQECMDYQVLTPENGPKPLSADPEMCCTFSNLCAGHRAKINPELLALIDAAPDEASKQKVVQEAIASAFIRGEWKP